MTIAKVDANQCVIIVLDGVDSVDEDTRHDYTRRVGDLGQRLWQLLSSRTTKLVRKVIVAVIVVAGRDW